MSKTQKLKEKWTDLDCYDKGLFPTGKYITIITDTEGALSNKEYGLICCNSNSTKSKCEFDRLPNTQLLFLNNKPVTNKSLCYRDSNVDNIADNQGKFDLESNSCIFKEQLSNFTPLLTKKPDNCEKINYLEISNDNNTGYYCCDQRRDANCHTEITNLGFTELGPTVNNVNCKIKRGDQIISTGKMDKGVCISKTLTPIENDAGTCQSLNFSGSKLKITGDNINETGEVCCVLNTDGNKCATQPNIRYGFNTNTESSINGRTCTHSNLFDSDQDFKGTIQNGICIKNVVPPDSEPTVCNFNTNNISCMNAPNYAYPLFKDQSKVCGEGTTVFCNGGELFECPGKNSWYPDVENPSGGYCDRPPL